MAVKVTEGFGFLIGHFDDGICLSPVGGDEHFRIEEEEGPEIADGSLIFLQNLFPDEIGWPHTNEKKKIRYKITVEVEEV